jgi:hypothetical protein
MVFQGTLLPVIGIMLTPWQPRIEILSGVMVTLVAAAWLRLNIRGQELLGMGVTRQQSFICDLFDDYFNEIIIINGAV